MVERRSFSGDTLTEYERKTLALVADGYKEVEIAELLGISPSSARSALARCRKRLKARTTYQAIAIAISRKEI